MYEQNLQKMNHSLFGEIQISQKENGCTLYKAASVARAIGIKDYKAYVGKTIQSFNIRIPKVNGLGYTTNMPIKFIDEEGIRQLILLAHEHEIHNSIKKYKERLLKL